MEGWTRDKHKGLYQPSSSRIGARELKWEFFFADSNPYVGQTHVGETIQLSPLYLIFYLSMSSPFILIFLIVLTNIVF